MNCCRCNKQATPFSDFCALWINEGKGLKHVTMCQDCFNKFDGERVADSRKQIQRQQVQQKRRTKANGNEGTGTR